MEVWEEPVRGGYPPPWMLTLPQQERSARWAELSPFPPIHYLTGLTPLDFGTVGETSCVMPASPWLASPQGRIPLGALAIVADMAFGSAIMGSIPLGGGFTTAELSLTRVRETTVGGDLVGHGKLVHASAGMGLTEARVVDSDGHLVAAGTSRLAMFPPLAEVPPVPDPIPAYEHPQYDTPDPWQRPVQGEVLDPEVWEKWSGREVLEAQITGELPPPPMGKLTGLTPTAVGEGTATVTMPSSEWMATPSATVQGGFTALIADAALACAIQSTVERGDSFVPVDIKVNYLRPVMPDGRLLTAEGTVTHRGRSLAVAHATVTNADGKPVALATGSATLTGLN